MKAIRILRELIREIEKLYDGTSDFENWENSSCDAEIIYDGIAYSINYKVIGYRKVIAELKGSFTIYKDGLLFWKTIEIDNDLKKFIESSIQQLIPMLYDELLSDEEEEKEEEGKDEEYNKTLNETYQSLIR